MFYTLLFLACFTCTTIVSVVLFKFAYDSLGFELSLNFIFRWGMNPFVISSLLLGLGSRVFFYLLIGQVGASTTYLLTAITFPAIAFVMWLFFKEHLTPIQIIGMLLIVMGIVMVGQGGDKIPGGL